MGLYLGIDIGGTKSRWDWLADGVEQVGIPGGTGDGIQAALLGSAAAGRRLGDLLQGIARRIPGDLAGADQEVRQVVVGMAGAGDPVVAGEVAEAAGACGPGWPLRVAGDIAVAAGCALDSGPGVVVWAGTGSFAVARSPEGRLFRVGGRGHLLGDQGSAHDLVVRGARAAMASVDGLGPETDLLPQLMEALDVASPGRLGVALQGMAPNRRAPLARMVFAAAEARDAVALQVLAEAAQDLALLVDAARARAGLDRDGLLVVRGGGVFGVSSRYGEDLDHALAQHGLDASRLCPVEASLGAARLALAVARSEQPLAGWLHGDSGGGSIDGSLGAESNSP